MNNTYLIFFLLLIIVLIVLNFFFKKNKKEQIIKTNAKIIKKYYGVDRSPENNGRSTAVRYRIVFNIDNGKQIELIASSQKYDDLQEDSTGILTYQGKKFIDFEIINS